MSNEIAGTFNNAFIRTQVDWYDAVLMLKIIGRQQVDEYIVIEEIFSHLSWFLKND